jgi:hypothetical protein
MWPAADERRLTLMENKWLIGVHRRRKIVVPKFLSRLFGL